MTQFFRSGGLASDVLADFINLWGKISAEDNVTHLRKNFTTVGYQVTAGKTLYLVKLVTFINTAGANFGGTKIGYADNDVGLDTTTARTSPVMAFGEDSTDDQGWPTPGFGSSLVNMLRLADHGMVWPIAAATKFPFARISASSTLPASVFAWCIEA